MILIFDILEFPSVTFGNKLCDQVEERLVYLETGAVPLKNITVMKEAVMENEQLRLQTNNAS